MSERSCDRCKHRDITLAKEPNHNGTWRIFRLCNNCGQYADSPVKWLSHAGVNLDFIPERPDRNNFQRHKCAVATCNNYDTEWQHFAPQHLQDKFTDNVNDWPCDWLCRKHHREWHRILTPEMSKIK